MSAGKVITCPGCGADQDDCDALYECGDCGETFTREESADGDSNRCPSCNRFAARVGTRCECGQDVLPEPEPAAEPGPCEVEIRVLRNPEPRQPSRHFPDRPHILAWVNCPGGVMGKTDPRWREALAAGTCLCYGPGRLHGGPVSPAATFTITEDVTGGPDDWPGWSDES
jgi:DNA-directed RNA polymerase subunit RPC12/RpoP